MYGSAALARWPMLGGEVIDVGAGGAQHDPLWWVLANVVTWTVIFGLLCAGGRAAANRPGMTTTTQPGRLRVADYADLIPPDRATGADRHAVLLGSCPWLLFLVWPAFVIVIAETPVGWKVLGLAGIGLFVVTYMQAMLHPRLFPALPRWVSTLCFSVVLVLAAAMMLPAAGISALNTTAYLCALWIFCHRLSLGAAGRPGVDRAGAAGHGADRR